VSAIIKAKSNESHKIAQHLTSSSPLLFMQFQTFQKFIFLASTRLHSATTQKTDTFILAPLRTLIFNFNGDLNSQPCPINMAPILLLLAPFIIYIPFPFVVGLLCAQLSMTSLAVTTNITATL
jgi:hypothetical protein